MRNDQDSLERLALVASWALHISELDDKYTLLNPCFLILVRAVGLFAIMEGESVCHFIAQAIELHTSAPFFKMNTSANACGRAPGGVDTGETTVLL